MLLRKYYRCTVVFSCCTVSSVGVLLRCSTLGGGCRLKTYRFENLLTWPAKFLTRRDEERSPCSICNLPDYSAAAATRLSPEEYYPTDQESSIFHPLIAATECHLLDDEKGLRLVRGASATAEGQCIISFQYYVYSHHWSNEPSFSSAISVPTYPTYLTPVCCCTFLRLDSAYVILHCSKPTECLLSRKRL